MEVSLSKVRPPHEIAIGERRFYVMLCPSRGGSALTQPIAQCNGPAYTREEWDTETTADHEFDGAQWTFQGRSLSATVTPILDWFRDPSGGDGHERSARLLGARGRNGTEPQSYATDPSGTPCEGSAPAGSARHAVPSRAGAHAGRGDEGV